MNDYIRDGDGKINYINQEHYIKLMAINSKGNGLMMTEEKVYTIIRMGIGTKGIGKMT